MMKFRRGSSRDSSTNHTKSRPEQAPSGSTSQMTISPRSVTSQSNHASAEAFDNYLRTARQVHVPISNDGRIQAVHDRSGLKGRSLSAQRTRTSSSYSDIRIVGRDERPRSKSAGRSALSDPLGSLDEKDEDERKQRKSKMEKIRQLQSKNELYKEEFKRVQKDRKKLKKELEQKNEEITHLNSQIDHHIEETSRLKSKLSEVMMKLDRTDQEDHADKSLITKLAKELAQTKDELNAALRRVSGLREELADMREYIRRKDEQIEALTLEVANQEVNINELNHEHAKLRQLHNKGQKEEEIIHRLVEENEKLQEELGSTLDRASAMVKEREDAIADLLKENDELKKLVDQQNEKPQITQEEVEQLRQELNDVHAQLEEAQDRNVLLEEEVEAWLARGTEMESMIDKLNVDVEAWQNKAKAAQDSLVLIEGQAVDAKADAAAARDSLSAAIAKHEAELAALSRKHESIVVELENKMFAERAEKQAESQQALLLQQAVAARKSSDPGKQGSGWRRFLAAGGSDDEEDNDEAKNQVKQLSKQNADKDEEIKALKSELVRLRSTYNENMYMNKKKIERLQQENVMYAAKTAELEKQLKEAKS